MISLRWWQGQHPKKHVLTEHLLLAQPELILPVQPISGMLKSAASTISAYHQMLTTDKRNTAGDLNGGAPAPKATAAARRRIFVGGGGVAKKTGGGGAPARRRALAYVSLTLSSLLHIWWAQTKSGLSHKNIFSIKSCQKCGLSPLFHWCLHLYSHIAI